MTDRARKQTDKELAHLEQKIYRLYATSQNELSEEWRKYMASHKKKLDTLYKELQDAKKSKDKEAIAEAQKKYETAVKNVTLNDKRYKAMINETTAKMANLNQTALDYVNGDMPKIYTLNYNEFGNQDIDGYTFTLTNEDAVRNLMLNNRLRLPTKQLDRVKDKRWNAKNINSQLMQGILMGESIDKISKRLQNVTNMNKASAVRNARTMVTSAENRGRQDSFKRAEKDGVIMVRKWVATHDERTRAWHADLDGVEVGVDEPWENDYGKIMYPGDPTADPANVYNCRCAIRAVVKGFRWNDSLEETRAIVIKDIENQDRGLDYERGAVISNGGTILARFDGSEHAVEVSDTDLKLMEGATFTHNHPNGGFFSNNDIITGFTKTSLGELRASTPQGITYVLQNNGATVESAKKYLADYQQTSMRAQRTAQEHFIRQIKAGELSMDEYKHDYYALYSQYRDEKLIKMTQDKAEEYGFIFKVEKNEK